MTEPLPTECPARFRPIAMLALRFGAMCCLIGSDASLLAQDGIRPPNPHAAPTPDPVLLEHPATGPVPPEPGEAAAPVAPATATRLDMAWAFLRFERALAAADPTGEALVRINGEFDDATFKYFRGAASEAVAALDDATIRLRGWEANDAAGAARRLRVRVTPPVWTYYSSPAPVIRVRAAASGSAVPGPPASLSVSIEPLNPGLGGGGGDREGEAAAPPRAVGVLVSVPDVRAAQAASGTSVDLSPFARSLPPGRYTAEIVGDGGFRWPVGWWTVVSAPREGVREALLEKLRAAEAVGGGDAGLRGAFRQARARLALLTDTPSEQSTAEILIDHGVLEAEVSLEVRSLGAGSDPYVRRAGLLYGAFVSGTAESEVSVPLWTFAPAAACEEGARPALVVVLHGAGADESMFMFGYGQGLIRDLATEKGFVVASPRAFAMTANPGVFDDLLAAMTARYDIDPSRVYVVGHSMGAIAASGLAQARAGSITAVAAIAGLRLFDTRQARVPVLAYGAEHDRIIPAGRVRANAEAAAQGGLPVEYREAPGQGHTLVVGAVLRECVDWLMTVTRPSASTPREGPDRP